MEKIKTRIDRFFTTYIEQLKEGSEDTVSKNTQTITKVTYNSTYILGFHPKAISNTTSLRVYN